MNGINMKRVWLGALAGGVAWNVFAMAAGLLLGSPQRVQGAQEAGVFLAEPRTALFIPLWMVMYFVLSFGCAWLYAHVRAKRGCGPEDRRARRPMDGFRGRIPGELRATQLAQCRSAPAGRVGHRSVGWRAGGDACGWLDIP